MKKALSFSLLSVVLLGACSGGPMSDTEKRAAACTYAQIEIKTILKNPSSAKFPACSRIDVEETSSNRFSVEGYVDAENSFGGSVRENYSCSVKLEEDDDSYYINCNLD